MVPPGPSKQWRLVLYQYTVSQEWGPGFIENFSHTDGPVLYVKYTIGNMSKITLCHLAVVFAVEPLQQYVLPCTKSENREESFGMCTFNLCLLQSKK